jgi:hypothetical protein
MQSANKQNMTEKSWKGAPLEVLNIHARLIMYFFLKPIVCQALQCLIFLAQIE